MFAARPVDKEGPNNSADLEDQQIWIAWIDESLCSSWCEAREVPEVSFVALVALHVASLQ